MRTVWRGAQASLGTSEVLNPTIQRGYYRELGMDRRVRDVEADAPDADLAAEKAYE